MNATRAGCKKPALAFFYHGAWWILLTGLWVYHNSFAGEFIFDDHTERIMQARFATFSAWAWELLRTSFRPLTELSWLFNYVVAGSWVESYHAINLTIHLLATLTLFGLAQLTLSRPIVSERYRSHAPGLALAIALLWLVHPLNTQSVTYLIQRAEALMGFWYLLTLYAVGRSALVPAARHWPLLAVAACAAGMASKPVMVTVPVMAVLYDRAFFAPSFAQLWRRRWKLYLGLMGSWAWLGVLLSRMPEGDSAGFDLGTVSWLEYARTQPQVILHYLKLAFWPTRLCLDYAWPVAEGFGAIVLPTAVLGLLLGVTWRVWCRAPSLGFIGVWFFLTLVPSSSVIPVADLAVEHRMYLPLIAVIAAVVMGCWWLVTRIVRTPRALALGAIGLLAGFVAILGTLTIRRNQDYRSAISIWTDTVAKRPQNPRAYNNLAAVLLNAERFPEAQTMAEEAIRLQNTAPIVYDPHMAYNNLGVALSRQGRLAEAVGQFEIALRLYPDFAEAQHNWGLALMQLGRYEEAIPHFQDALQVQPDFAEVHHSWGVVLARQGQYAEAITHFAEAVRLQPTFAEAHHNWGLALIQQHQYEQALEHIATALRLQPDLAEAYNTMGSLLAGQRDWRQAESAFRTAIRLKPTLAQAHDNLGRVLADQGKSAEAIPCYQEALRLDPGLAETKRRLDILLSGGPSR